MSDYLATLNPEQQAAVTALAGPLLVLAGAGSGKTRVLTHRLAHLIATGTARPDELLAVTFTNKAAKEMRARVSALVGAKQAGQLAMGTFHGLGVRVLREQHQLAPRSANFSIVDASDSARLIREACKTLAINTQQLSPRVIQHIISKAKSTQTSPAALTQHSASPITAAAAAVYPVYEQLLARHNSYDFDDLIIAPLQLLMAHETVRRQYQARWRYLSVDEYQDTNPAQDALLKLLLGPEQNLCAVGDDYQAIYSWRGARVDHILQFETHFPGCTTIYLTQNYRSTTPILEAANHLIAANAGQKHKKLWTDQIEGAAVEIVATVSDRAEAALVRTGMEEALKAGIAASQCAVLYRTNAQSRVLEEELLLHNIPYQVVGGTRFYDRAEVKDAIALLQLSIQPHAALSLARIVKTLVPGVGAKTLQRIINHAAEAQISLLTALTDPKLLTLRLQASFAPLLNAFTEATQLNESTVATKLETLLQVSGYYRYLKSEERAQERLENIEELQNVAAKYSDPVKFIEDITLMSDIDEAHGVKDRVLCMTLHAAKGLEFERVWIVGCEEGLLPHRSSLNNSAELEEERRLLYVGMTRAKEHLTLAYAKTRTLHGEVTPQGPSRFFKNLPQHIVHNTVDTTTHQSFLEADGTADGSWGIDGHDVGELVSHPHFGQGVIIQISGSLVTCVFPGHGVKTLDAATTSA